MAACVPCPVWSQVSHTNTLAPGYSELPWLPVYLAQCLNVGERSDAVEVLLSVSRREVVLLPKHRLHEPEEVAVQTILGRERIHYTAVTVVSYPGSPLPFYYSAIIKGNKDNMINVHLI